MLDVWLPLGGGLFLLVAGGELLVRGAVRAAEVLGVSPLVIGLTLVGFGTSTPELVASLQAALAGSPGIAYGNVVGSNIANILLILGVTALIFPITVTSRALKRDGATMLAAAAVFALLSALLPMDRIAGLAFVVCLGFYIYLAFRQERAAGRQDHGALHDKTEALMTVDPALNPDRPSKGPLWIAILTALAGLVLVIGGGKFLVDGAVALARDFGLSETVIGLTVVAIGTSMPELVTSLVAAVKRQTDVAFGNIVGSNIYNILGIGGMTALVAPGQVPEQVVGFDNLVMLAVSALLIAAAYTGLRLVRLEGAAFLAGYLAYLYYIWPT